MVDQSMSMIMWRSKVLQNITVQTKSKICVAVDEICVVMAYKAKNKSKIEGVFKLKVQVKQS